MDSLEKYWKLYVSGLILVLSFGLVLYNESETSKNEAKEEELMAEIIELETKLKRDESIDEDEEIKVIEKSGTHVRDMGEEMISYQKILAKEHRRADFTADDKKSDKVIEAEKGFTRLTNKTNYADTWLMNPNWDMKLESVGIYADVDKIPVVFTMDTEDGDLAGVVRAVYRVDDDLLEDIQIDHTIKGFETQVDSGGE